MGRSLRITVGIIGLVLICACDEMEKPMNPPKPKSQAPSQLDNTPATSKIDKEDLKKKLTAEQFEVTQNCGTEPPFKNAYWDNHEDGIYVDVVSGEPLFSSLDKYDSGTGWPSFNKPIEQNHLVEKVDNKMFMPRTEIR